MESNKENVNNNWFISVDMFYYSNGNSMKSKFTIVVTVCILLLSYLIFVVVFFVFPKIKESIQKKECTGNQSYYLWECKENTKSCPINNWHWLQHWNWTWYAICQLSSCNEWFEKKNNICIDSVGSIDIKPIRDISLSPIQNVERTINSGVSWKDFIIKIPDKQPNIVWKTKGENNLIMHNYIASSQLEFAIPPGKNWYLMIVTSKPVAPKKDLFLWIRWITLWALHKNKWLPTNDTRKYLFSINSLPIADYTYWINLFDKAINWKVKIWAFVGEKDNSVEKIIMVFY